MSWTRALIRQYGTPEDGETGTENCTRAERGQAALDCYAEAIRNLEDDEDATTATVDLIADLLHLSALHNEDPRQAVAQAWQHFVAEVGAGYEGATE